MPGLFPIGGSGRPSVFSYVSRHILRRLSFKRHVFVSFEYADDRDSRYVLEGWNTLQRFSFSSRETLTWDASPPDLAPIKTDIHAKVTRSKLTLVIVGKSANALHSRHEAIGYRNWINFEIAESRAAGNRIVAVKLDPAFEPPEQLVGARVDWVPSFTRADLLEELTKR